LIHQQEKLPMNKDFVPLSSLLEDIKKTSFEGVSAKEVNTTSDEKSKVADESRSSSPVDVSDQKEPAQVSVPEPEKECKEPKILLDREGDKISRIRVLCSCGQSIVLDCNYSDKS
jgi:hypothetical protein